MSTFPITIRRRAYASAAELAQELRERVVGDVRDNPGQAYPSEHFMGQGDAVDAALYEALSILVDDDHPEVLRAITHLGLGHPDSSFWRALIDRVAGTGVALPSEVADDVGRFLVDPVATGSLLIRGLAAFDSAGMPDHVLRVRLHAGGTSDRISALALAVGAGKVDAGLAKRAGRTLARKDGADAVLSGAAAMWNADEDVRAGFRDGAIRGDGSWAHRDDLTQALRLDA